jgi:hypothetical protein
MAGLPMWVDGVPQIYTACVERSPPRRPVGCDRFVVRYCDIAQALELVRALRHQLHEMTTQLAWVERQHVTGRNGRACAMRLEAAALRRDIKEAQVLIDRLQLRYLNGDGESGARDSQRSSSSTCSGRW